MQSPGQSAPKKKCIVYIDGYREVACGAVCRLKYHAPEEKKTDVNIAITLIDDVINDMADSVVVVSGDSDLEPAVAWVRRTHPQIKVTVYIPSSPEEQPQRRNDFYRHIGVACKFLPASELLKHQLPSCVRVPNGKEVQRPETWR